MDYDEKRQRRREQARIRAQRRRARRKEILDNGRALSVTIEEAVDLTGLGRTGLFRAVSEGSLPSRLVNGRRLILHSDLVAWLRGRVQNAA